MKEFASAAERRAQIARLIQEGVGDNTSKYKVKRFKLDNARSRQMVGENSHEFGSNIKSFWVCDWSGNFKAKLVPNHKYDRDETSGIQLRKNMALSFDLPVSDACLEFDAQSGAWIDIAYSDLEDIDVKNIELSISGDVGIDEGSTNASVKCTATTTTSTVIAADSTRKVAILQHKSGGSVWVGNPSELADPDYKNICTEWPAGSTITWKNKGALSWKTDAGTVVFSMMSLKV